MGDAAAGALVLVLLALIVGVFYARYRARSDLRAAPWRVLEHSRDGRVVICCERPGEDELMIGAVLATEEDRGYKIAELRADADEACAELNAGRPRRSRGA